MLTTIGVALCGFIVGVLTGVTGMGGILIPPCMIVLLGIDTHLAMGTSLASFLPSCVLAVWTHYRNGNILWPTVWPIAGAGLVCVFLGTELKAYSPGDTLNILLGILIIGVGSLTFRPVTASAADGGESLSRTPALKLALLGGSVGVIAGLTGAGGPVLILPVMIAMGYKPLNAIATGLVYVIAVCIAGTVGNALHGAVDFSLAALCAAGQVAGVWVGLAVAKGLDTAMLKKLVGWVCVLTGGGIVCKTLFAWL